MVKAREDVVEVEREIGPESVEIPREVEKIEEGSEISVEGKDELKSSVGETLRKRHTESCHH